MAIDTSSAPESSLPTRRTIVGAVAAALCGAAAPVFAQAPAFPTKPVRIIVSFTPGGLVDSFVRYVADGLAAKWKQTVVIENKPGANQLIGAEAAVHSKPDGYTLYVGTQSGLVFNSILRKNLRFDLIKDFTAVSPLFRTPFYLVVNPRLKVKTVPELVALAKASPGKLTYASIGPGSAQQIAGELFKTLTGTDILHVAYKGSAPALQDLLGGQVDIMFEGGASVLPSVETGKLTALASSGTQRSEAMPQLPTIAESVRGYELTSWIGLVAPTGTPSDIVNQINRDLTAVLDMPATHKQFAPFGIEVMTMPPAQFSLLITSDVPRWEAFMKQAKIEI